jgi:hypothetical protein
MMKIKTKGRRFRPEYAKTFYTKSSRNGANTSTNTPTSKATARVRYEEEYNKYHLV